MKERGKYSFSKPLQGLRYKGNRDYLHGTDIFSMCLQMLSDKHASFAITNIDFAFHGLAKMGLTMCTSPPPGVEPKAQLSCKINGIQQKYFLVESNDAISQRIDYPEDKIVAATDIDIEAATATSMHILPFTNIERWVAMVKALHYSLYPDLSGRWLFVRGKFTDYRDSYGTVVEHKIVLQANFNNKLTRSALLVDGQKLGDIFFSLE